MLKSEYFQCQTEKLSYFNDYYHICQIFYKFASTKNNEMHISNFNLRIEMYIVSKKQINEKL